MGFVVGLVLLLAIVVMLAVGHRVRREGASERDALGRHVVVAVARPGSAVCLSELGLALARPARGLVAPLTVVTPDTSPQVRKLASETIRRCEARAIESGVQTAGHVRVAASLGEGILHGVAEHEGSSLVIGWPSVDDTGRLGEAMEDVLTRAPLPVLVARVDDDRWDAVVLRVPREPLTPGLRASLRFATDVAGRLRDSMGRSVRCIPFDGRTAAPASQLVITPVAPDIAEIRRAIAGAEPFGDICLAICHGARPPESRPSLAAVSALYERDAGAVEAASTRQLSWRAGQR